MKINRCNAESEWQLGLSLYRRNPQLRNVLFHRFMPSNRPYIGSTITSTRTLYFLQINKMRHRFSPP